MVCACPSRDKLPLARWLGYSVDRSAPVRASAWPVRGQPGGQSRGIRCPPLRVRTRSPFHSFLSNFWARRNLGVPILLGNLRNQLSQGRYFVGPEQLDLPVAGFDFQEITFFEAGLLDDRLRDAHCQTIAPLDHLSLHNLAPCRLATIRSIHNNRYIVYTRKCAADGEWNGTSLNRFPNPANAANDAWYVGAGS